jgi:hypothetical protein
MKTETIEHIKKLKGISSAVETYFDAYTNETEKPTCDKYGCGFLDRDNRFNVFSLSLKFNAYTGYYGNSSCCTFSAGVDREIFPKYIEKAIENKREELFEIAASMMKADAAKLKDKAEAEIAGLKELIDSV